MVKLLNDFEILFMVSVSDFNEKRVAVQVESERGAACGSSSQEQFPFCSLSLSWAPCWFGVAAVGPT